LEKGEGKGICGIELREAIENGVFTAWRKAACAIQSG